MVGLGWILAIVIGALAGWLAGKIMHSTHGLLMDIVLGIVGAVIGNFLLMTIFGAPIGAIDETKLLRSRRDRAEFRPRCAGIGRDGNPRPGSQWLHCR